MRIAYFIQSVQQFSKLPIGGVEQALQKIQGYLLDSGNIAHIINCNQSKIAIPQLEDLEIVHISGTWTDFGTKIAEFYKGKVPVLISPVYNDRSLLLEEYTDWLLSKCKNKEAESVTNLQTDLKKNIVSVCQLADVIIVLGEGEKEALIEAGVSAKARFEVIPNGVDVSVIKAVESSWQIPVSQAIFCPARYEVNKNQLRLIQAFERLKQIAPQAQLWLAGADFEPEYKQECIDYAESHGLEVHWLGLRPILEVLYLMKAARVIAIPSLSECVPLVTLEAAALGKPILCTEYSYISEYLDKWPQICNPLDVNSIFQALRLAWLQSENPDLALKIKQQYDWRDICDRLIALYGDIADEKS